jgi:hypothetical protein
MALLYYGFPLLPIEGEGVAFVFSVSWLTFAIIAIGGNLAEFLYQPARKKKGTQNTLSMNTEVKKRQRMY